MQDSSYYQDELLILRELAAEFSREYPALAPMLATPGTDPDVERLLEGTAYLSSFVKQHLDDEFPEIVQGIIRQTFPHYLRPLPATTLIQFMPDAAETVIRRGVELHSVAVDGVVCRFTTSAEARVLPLNLTKTSLQRHPDGSSQLRLSFTAGAALAGMGFSTLPLFLTGAYPEASDLHRFILDHTESIAIESEKRSVNLPADCLEGGGFLDGEPLLPWPQKAFRGYRLLQEYYLLPEKFLVLRLTGLERWAPRPAGRTFDVVFRLRVAKERIPEVQPASFSLNVVPAVNIFPHVSEPIAIDHRRHEYMIHPQGYPPETCQIFSIRRVAARNPLNNQAREFQALADMVGDRPDTPVYAVHQRRSENDGLIRNSISVAWPDIARVQNEVLSVDLLCTNVDLPSRLRVGDVREPTDSSPKGIAFRNITPPTTAAQPPLGRAMLWKLLSHFHANLTSLMSAQVLREMAALYIFPDNRDRQRLAANHRKVAAIRDCRAESSVHFARGVPMRGQDIVLTLDRSGFASHGDMRLFGDILSRFFSEYAALNCYTRTRVVDADSGENWLGVPRLGERPLL